MAAMPRTMTPSEKGKRILLWLGFSVVFALAPLFINFLLVRGEPDFNLSKVYERGELFLISAALCADATGRLFNHKGNPSFLLIICTMAVIYLLFTSTVEYGTVAKNVYDGQSINPAVSSDSWKQFIATVLACLGAVFMEE
jgi:hypothetical protein